MEVIVNADDFGIDKNRTKAILRSLELGAITHTTAMANMPYFGKAVLQINEAGLIDRMGLHLNLTEGRPLTEAMQKCRFFCDEEGMYTCDFHNTIKYRFILPEHVKPIVAEEARAQMKAFRDAGATSAHLDSHHHVHTDISIARIVLPIAKEFGFKTVRLSRNFGGLLSLDKHIYKWYFNNFVVKPFGAYTDFFCGFGDFEQMHAKLPRNAKVEIMVHPMYGTSVEALDMNGELTDSGRPISDESALYARLRTEGVIE